MHAHIYIYNAQGRHWNAKKEENEMYVGSAMAAVSI
jgi:hypothetical protein